MMPRYFIEVTSAHAKQLAWARAERERRAGEISRIGSMAEHGEMKAKWAYRRRDAGLTRSQAKFWLAVIEREIDPTLPPLTARRPQLCPVL